MLLPTVGRGPTGLAGTGEEPADLCLSRTISIDTSLGLAGAFSGKTPGDKPP